MTPIKSAFTICAIMLVGVLGAIAVDYNTPDKIVVEVEGLDHRIGSCLQTLKTSTVTSTAECKEMVQYGDKMMHGSPVAWIREKVDNGEIHRGNFEYIKGIILVFRDTLEFMQDIDDGKYDKKGKLDVI